MKRAAAALLSLVAVSALGQEPKNVKILTGLSPIQLQRTMNFIRGSLGVHCDFCHVTTEDGGWNFASDEKKTKQTARAMIQMTIDINQKSFGAATGRPPVVTCNTCHRGAIRPVAQPVMPQPQPPFPTPVVERPKAPEVKAIVDKYAAALGDVSKLASRRSKGTRIAADGETKAPLEVAERGLARIHVKAGAQEQAIGPDGGWVVTKDGVKAMNAGQEENFRSLAEGFALLVPGDISADANVVTRENLNDHPAWLVSMRPRDGLRVKLWFDADSGLLVRRQILTKSPVGEIPMQTDFSDYRDAGGVKVPFTVKVSSIDPWIGSTRQYSEVVVGASLSDSEFVMPK